MSPPSPAGQDDTFTHQALPYRDDGEYLAGLLGFVRAALAADQPVLVEVPGPRLDLVREALDGDVARVRFGDMTRDGRNPGRIIPAVLRCFVDAHPCRRVAIVGEPLWPERTTHAYAAVVQHEALINLVFAGDNASILCPYDLTHLPARALADAERTHPALVHDGHAVTSTHYADPRTVAAKVAEDQSSPPPDAEVFDFTVISKAREAVHGWAAQHGLPPERVTDLVIAVSEVAGNSIVYAGDGARLLRWAEGRSLVCEIRDHGHITDPLAGRLPPPPSQESGRGLLMVNYLCDLVQIRTGPSGTAIRLWMDLPQH